MATERPYNRTESPSYAIEPKKRSKFVGNFLAHFGMKNNDEASVNNTSDNSVAMDESTSMAQFNRFRSANLGNRNISDITALRLYHESLKKQNNDRYSRLLGETSSYEPQSDTHSIQEDQTFDNDSNNTVIQHEIRGEKRPFKESRDSSFVIPTAQRVQSIPNLRQQLSRVNPRERSNLINLKRKMKLDAYYRRKMNYLNYFNKNNAHSNNASFDNSMMSMNTSFQPHDKRAELKSTKKLQKPDSHIDKKIKTQEITNTSGVFNGSFMYDLDEEEQEEEKDNNAIGYKPINIEFKSDKNKYGPKTLAPGMENIIGGQKKAPSAKEVTTISEMDKIPLNLKEDIKVGNKKEEIIGPSSSFKFATNSGAGNVNEEASGSATSNGFNFEKKDSNVTTSAITFGNSKPQLEIPAIHSQPELPANSFSLDKKKDEAPKVAFSFGGDTASDKDKEPKPSPSFNFNTPAPSLGNVAAKESEAPKPSFSFGNVATKKDDVAKPAFAFGTAEKTDNKTGFSFGETVKKDETVKKPEFSFGGTENKESNSKPHFSFGNTEKPTESLTPSLGNTEQKADAVKPSFSFSGSSEQKETVAKPAFSFGSAAEKKDDAMKPSFSFGDAQKKDDATKPSFSFGDAQKKEDATKPSFSFGDAQKKDDAAKPSFSFGDAQKKEDATKPSFSFGNTAKPAFSFGNTEKKQDNGTANATSFAFNQASTESKAGTNSQSNAPFSFGSSAPAKPAFSFPTSATKGDDDEEEEKEQSERKRRFAGSKTDSAVTGNTFSFGSGGINGDNKTAIESPKPTASFGFANGGIKNGGFSFGNGHSSTPSVSSEKGNTTKPGFNFNTGGNLGATTAVANSSRESTPAGVANEGGAKFEFGANATAAGAKPTLGITASTTPFASSGKSTPVNGQPQAQAPVSSFQFNPGGAKADPASVFGAGAQSQGFNFNNTSNPSTTFNPSRSATPGSFNFNGNAGTMNPASVFGNQQQQPPNSVFGNTNTNAQPGNMFGVGNGAASAGNTFGGFGNNQPQPQQGGLFGGQQQVGQPNMFGNGVGSTASTGTTTPAPTSGTPVPIRRLARMRQPRSHR